MSSYCFSLCRTVSGYIKYLNNKSITIKVMPKYYCVVPGNSPMEGFLFCTPSPAGNSSLALYFSSKSWLLSPPPPPQEFPMTFCGWKMDTFWNYTFLGGYFTIIYLLKLQFSAMLTYTFHLYSPSSHHFILCFIPFTG